jgi:Fe-S cluster assembly protein SufD
MNNIALQYTPTAQEPAWLAALRQQALLEFKRLGFPTLKDEDWKYTRLSALSQQSFALPTINSMATHTAKLSLPALDSYQLVFSNGQLQQQASSLPAGVKLCSLRQAASSYPELVQPFLTQIAHSDKHGLQALNAAYLQDGYFLHLSPGVQLKQAIHVLFISEQQPQASVYHLRNLIVAEEHSEAVIIEHYMSTSEQVYWNNVVTEAHLKTDAKLEHIKVQQEGPTAYHIGTLSVCQQTSSTLTSHSYALGGRLVRSDTDVVQQGEHAMSKLYGLYLANNKQHIDHHTSVLHSMPHGSSLEHYKGIVTDQARAVFNGKVVVQEDAQKIDASQTNNNLLLSDQAEIDTKPQLEIYADDVRCAHGATVGQLASEQLFYLRARGLSEQTARYLLIQAFAQEVLATLAHPALGDFLQHAIQEKLGLEEEL